MSFYHYEKSPKAKKGLFPKILVNDVRILPIKRGSKIIEEGIIELVGLLLKTKDNNLNTEPNKPEKKIDEYVYLIYDLAPEEIAIAEGKTK